MAQPHALLAGRYRLVRQVGRGGMGVVWEARDERLERPVAVKVLRPQVGLSAEDAELAKNRAMREARITARLHHRNAVPVFDVVEHEGQPCLVMQYLPSVPLSAVLRESGPLGVHEAASIGAQVASALAAAHQLGIVHRDVKPGNILVTDDGTALLSDFGISHALGDATLTSTGLVHGTPAYLAPEVARGADSSHASDVFSLGATLYAATEGGPPFGTDANSIALLYRVASGEFAPPARAGALTPVLLDMLRSDPEARPPMREVAARLAAVEAGDAEPPATAPAAGGVPVADDATTAVRARSAEPAPTLAASPPTLAGPPTFAAAAAAPAPAPVAGVRAAGPPSPGGPGPVRRSRAGRVVAAVALLVGLVVLGTVVLTGQLGRGGTGTAADPTGGTSAPAASPAGSPSGSEPSPERSTSSSPSDEPSASPTPSASRTTPSPSPTPTEGSGEPTARELSAAITRYYGLVPDDTDEAWGLMTSDYQRTKSGGRQAYERFWGQVDDVKVSKVKADPPSRVEATLTYDRGGSVSVERTTFRMVRDDGILKIADSDVVGAG
ncbi:serine/threonine-protein kinase [Microlunatus flavus]|uniref:non-specific serine/threonine protein kinase n=1 Tax=Microlunatus flavus TaxID=1036181 RepID=A0A1H9FN15_9ACTN|nr:serine/threonine-protein kinase [Microlunatus flavus]SEQ39351.1 Serine/threonine protein kinase [Microlunatus flavus]